MRLVTLSSSGVHSVVSAPLVVVSLAVLLQVEVEIISHEARRVRAYYYMPIRLWRAVRGECVCCGDAVCPEWNIVFTVCLPRVIFDPCAGICT